MAKHTITKKRRDEIVQVFADEDVIDFTRIPFSKIAALGGLLSTRQFSEAFDWYAEETAGQIPRLERIQGPPVPKYQWVREVSGEGGGID